jgi:hypothetical protein
MPEPMRESCFQSESTDAASPDSALSAIPEQSRCPYCREEIRADAVKCKHRGEFVDAGLRESRAGAQKSEPSPGVAAVLSLVIPGAGQMYRGHVGRGFMWLALTVCGYCAFILPGLIAHICCVIMAATQE